MENAVNGHLGKVITSIEMSDDTLTIRFADGMGLKLLDEARFCCERRYMHTDDDLFGVVGGRLYGIDVRDAPSVEDEYGEAHDVQFLVVMTSEGEVTVCTHNEHNGYYGGFYLVAETLFPSMMN